MVNLLQPGTGGFLNPKEILGRLEIKEGTVIADFGCGAGYFSIPLAKIVGKDGKIIAIDIQKSALESVRSQARLEGLLNIETVLADLEIEKGSGLTESSVDLVLVANILFQAEKKLNVFQEAKRVLKSGGLIVVLEWDPQALPNLGPSPELRVPKSQVQALAKEADLKEEKEIYTGSYHYGLIFRKIEK